MEQYQSTWVPRALNGFQKLFGVWWELCVGSFISPYFIVNNIGQTITVDDELYRSTITNFFWLVLDHPFTNPIGGQKDIATWHTAHAILDILHEQFEYM